MEFPAESFFVKTFILEPDGRIPNNRLPVLLYRGGLSPELRVASQCQTLFRENDWTGNWVDGILDYWHFHVTGHEVLGCVAGHARLGLGGDRGIALDVAAGDVLVLPAGTGHRRLDASGDFSVVGGYPPGQDGAITRPEEIGFDEAVARLADLALPASDPLGGPEGPLVSAWGLR